MNRNHKIYTVTLDVQRESYRDDAYGDRIPESREVFRKQETVVCIATSGAVALAVMFENSFRYPDAKVLNVTETKIDTIVETHTY